jgi:lipopolysaccharide biosynthesis glycosyltransferase
MDDTSLQFACATDRSYLEMTGVLIASITSQKHRAHVKIYVFCTRLRARDKARLTRCLTGPATLIFKDIDGERFAALSGLMARRHLTVTAYSRILIPEMVPDVKGRVLYLDCDVVVNAPLDDLFRVDLEGKPAGAARNQVPVERLAALNRPLNRDPTTPYFNSGVLLIDILAWRRQNISTRGMDFARTWKAESGDHDQAVLNHVLSGNWKEIDPKWNSNPARTTPEEALVMPVQHFWGKQKPFFSEYPKPHRQVYDRYRQMTPWRWTWRKTRIERSLRKRIEELRKRWAR